MIFKRRERPSTWSRLREFMYPRKGFWRGFGYVGKRMRRLPDTPHRIALGFAAGAFASFTPFFTLHFVIAALVAWLVRGNIVAALFGTIVGNPLSFPAIAYASLSFGRSLIGREGGASDFHAVMAGFAAGAQSAWDALKALFGGPPATLDGVVLFLDDVFLPYLVGGAPLGIVAGFVSYWTLGPLIAAYQTRRQRRLDARAAERRKAAFREQDAYALRDAREGDNA